MRKALFVIATLIIGILVHLVFNRYLSHYGIGPHLLLLFVVAMGFVMGPFMGETFGFIWGLMMDSMGVSFFGLQSFLFALAGYISGKLSKRVASERTTAQLVIAIVTTAYYFGGTAFVISILGTDDQPVSWPLILLGTFFNVLLVTAVFWIVEWWVELWEMKQEQN